MILKSYLSQLDEALRENNATEHTHRPALKRLLESINDLRATNEPSRIEYTPEPVVSYIVRSVDNVLKTQFDCPGGLADQSMITIKNLDQSLRVKGKDSEVRKTTQSHKVIILDPATGTGTFLYSVVDFIRQQFIASGNAGMWPGYVKQHLLPRLFGFEFMVAPFAVAHFKLSLQLAGRDLAEDSRDQWAFHPEGADRLGVFLTNMLDEAHEHTARPPCRQGTAPELRRTSSTGRGGVAF